MRAATGERAANRRADATNRRPNVRAMISTVVPIHSDHNTKSGLGSAEDDSDAMCFLVIGKHDAEVAVEGDAIDLH